ncbi:hypothetical protein PG988_004926 [Apiospora saccharicola]
MSQRFYVQRTVVQELSSSRKRKAKVTTTDQESTTNVFFPKRQKKQSRTAGETSAQDVIEMTRGREANEESPGGSHHTDKKRWVPVSTRENLELPLHGCDHQKPLESQQHELANKWLGTVGPQSLVDNWSGASYHECPIAEKESVDKVLRVHKRWVEQESPSMALVENIDHLRQSLLHAVSTLKKAQMAGGKGGN